VPRTPRKIESTGAPVALSTPPLKKSVIPSSQNMTFFDPTIWLAQYETIRALRSIAVRSLTQPWIWPLAADHLWAQENFRQEGIKGLLPQSGSKKPRKLTPEVPLTSRSLRHQSPISKLLRWLREFEDASVSFSIPHCRKALRKKGPQAP